MPQVLPAQICEATPIACDFRSTCTRLTAAVFAKRVECGAFRRF